MPTAARPFRTPPRPAGPAVAESARRVPGRALPPRPAERRPRVAAERLRGWRAAFALSALVGVTALFPRAALRDAETLAAAEATLVRPAGFGALAPFYTVSDELALLSVRQHLSLIGAALIAYLAWRVVRRARDGRRRARRWARGALGEAGGVLAFVAGVVALYAYVCLVPRPMAALAVSDPDLVRVDFHAHTGVSHDGLPWFTAEDRRAWHRAGGFDVAYVTDHGEFTGAEAGVAGNPALAGEGTVLLSGVEAWSGGEHLNVLGVTAADSGLVTADEQLDDAAIARAIARGRQPVLIETVPGFLDTLVAGVRGGFPGRSITRVTALELSDAAPRGFDQTDSTRERVLRLADSLDLALVAGSDNHGWGRTAAAWSLMTIPGWRDMTPAALGEAIERRLLTERRRAVRVVERDRPRTVRGAGIPLNVPIVGWHFFATLHPAERVGWLAWVWGAALLGAAARRVRLRRTRRAAEVKRVPLRAA